MCKQDQQVPAIAGGFMAKRACNTRNKSTRRVVKRSQ
jgi:hypothetical protein